MAQHLDKTWNEIDAAVEAGKLVKVPFKNIHEKLNGSSSAEVMTSSLDADAPGGAGVDVFVATVLYYDSNGDTRTAPFLTLDPDDYPIDPESFEASLDDGGAQEES